MNNNQLLRVYPVLDTYILNFDKACKLDPKADLNKFAIGVGSCGLDSSGSGQGPMVASCEYGNEPSGSIKGREFLN
jgi:hypothetical protein